MKLDSFIFTHNGGKDHNEDSVGHGTYSDGEFFIVADGLGGHAKGELASQCVIQSLQEAPEVEGEKPEMDLVRRFELAHQAVTQLQQETQGHMKSTAVMLSIRQDTACWRYVGDSRLYYFHDGRIQTVTEDHSVAYRKYKAKEITREQIPEDEDQTSLLRVMGSERHEGQSGHVMKLSPGDGFLLCSDGLWTVISEQEMLLDYLTADTAASWAGHMLLRYRERLNPSRDNVSVICVLVGQDVKTKSGS